MQMTYGRALAALPAALAVVAAATGCYGGAKLEFPTGATGPVTLPMILDPLEPVIPIVEVTVRGVEGPLFFSIETEESFSWINPHVVTAGRFDVFTRSSYHGTGLIFRNAHIPAVELGPLVIRDHSWATGIEGEPRWLPIAGIIGADVLRNLDLVIDYQAGTVTFFPAGKAPAAGTPIPIRLRGTGMPGVLVRLDDGTTVDLTLASGYTRSLVHPGVLASKGAPFRSHEVTRYVATEFSSVEGRTFRVETLHSVRAAHPRAGGVELPAFELEQTKDAPHAAYSAADGMLAGGDLAHHRVTMSLSRKKLWLERREGAFGRRTTIAARMSAVGRERVARSPDDALGHWLIASSASWLVDGLEIERSLGVLAERYVGEGAYARAWGNLAWTRGDATESEARLARAVIDVGATYTPLLVSHAAALIRVGRRAEATARTKEVIEANGGSGAFAKLWIDAARKKVVLEEAYATRARSLYLEGDLEGALAAARDASSTLGDYLPGRWLLGRIYLARKEVAFAADQYEFLLDDVGVDPAEVIDAWAEFERLGDLEALLTKLRDGAAKEGWSLELDRALGLLHREAAAPAKSVEAYERAAAAPAVTFEQRVQVIYSLAWDLGRFEEALAKLADVRRDFPDRDMSLDVFRFDSAATLGAVRRRVSSLPFGAPERVADASLLEVEADVLFMSAKYTAALAASDRALAAWPNANGAREVKARALLRLGRHAECIDVLRKLAVDGDENLDVWVFALRALGRTAEASLPGKALVARARDDLVTSPRSSDAHAMLALALAWTGESPEEAVRLAEQAEALRAGALLAKIALAEALLAKGDRAGARAAAERALRIVPWDSWARWIVERAK